MIFTNLELSHFKFEFMKIKPLTQLRELIEAALKSQTNLSKPFHTFFKETMELFLTIPNRINFLQMGRFGQSSEQRFRMNFRKKSVDWIQLNESFIAEGNPERRAIAIDPSYISKSGKKTPGVGYFWSGCASSMKWGLELMGCALVDADNDSGTHLIARQTITRRFVGRPPYYLMHMDNPNSLVGLYLRTLASLKDELLPISGCIVADAFFSKESFVTGLDALGFRLISRFRDDVRLKYLYTGPKTGKRGRPKKFSGDVDLADLDRNVFETYTSGDAILHSATVWAVSLKRNVKVVIADFDEPGKKTQSKKVFFSTDTSKSAVDIFGIYKTRFQIEFLYRDAKQYTGLCDCQSRNSDALDFAFNMSLSTINIARQFAAQQETTLSVGDVKVLLHNAAMVERLFSMFGKNPNLKINETDFKELLFYGIKAAA